MKISITTLTALFICNITLAQQTINPNIKHDWEDSRYTVNNDTVLDNNTGLMWKRCAEGLSGSVCDVGTATAYNWQEALGVVNNYTFAGFNDWRLPNIKELNSIVAYDRYTPAINSTIFPNTPSDWFWSSSPDAFLTSYAWRLNFDDGNSSNIHRSNNYYVRLVRGGQ